MLDSEVAAVDLVMAALRKMASRAILSQVALLVGWRKVRLTRLKVSGFQTYIRDTDFLYCRRRVRRNVLRE
jgi:hypothetical protein